MDREPAEALQAISSEVSTSSTKQRIQIFKHSLPAVVRNSGDLRDSQWDLISSRFYLVLANMLISAEKENTSIIMSTE